MSGTGFSIAIHTDRKRPKLTVNELHSMIWRYIYKHLYPIANRSASRNVISYYLRDEANDGLAGRWESSPTELSFTFMDAAGCCSMSSIVSAHWSMIIYKDIHASINDTTSNYGWIISDISTSMEELLNNNHYPIIELNNKLYCVGKIETDAGDAEYELFTDGGEILALKDLSASQRKRVMTMINSKTCLCQICKHYQAKITKQT